ncbi:excisionase family DNA-binding protein [Serratia proteamaculans]|uniref:excisionase family DNA-binding protein n=1 Tax=Serratia proteamaculans TaxID=28151 RepID=UPI0021C5E35F|nr:excisionase family DNA-binding protein [Serratia proteamaculans]
MEKLTLTKKEAAELLGVSATTITKWVASGRLTAYRVSNKPTSRYLFTKEDCLAALSKVGGGDRHASSDNLRRAISASYIDIIRNKKKMAKELEVLLAPRSKGKKLS